MAAFQARGAVCDLKDATVAFLKDRVRPIAAVDARRLQQLVTNLGDERFAVRQQATDELAGLSSQAVPALKQFLDTKPPLEILRRAESLLAQAEKGVLADEELRFWRSLEVLELIGSPAARQVLEKIAQGLAGHRLTEEAQAAEKRLARRLAASGTR